MFRLTDNHYVASTNTEIVQAAPPPTLQNELARQQAGGMKESQVWKVHYSQDILFIRPSKERIDCIYRKNAEKPGKYVCCDVCSKWSHYNCVFAAEEPEPDTWTCFFCILQAKFVRSLLLSFFFILYFIFLSFKFTNVF